MLILLLFISLLQIYLSFAEDGRVKVRPSPFVEVAGHGGVQIAKAIRSPFVEVAGYGDVQRAETRRSTFLEIGKSASVVRKVVGLVPQVAKKNVPGKTKIVTQTQQKNANSKIISSSEPIRMLRNIRTSLEDSVL